jgi:cytochrome c oxidase cbb3-type subunit III
MAVRSVRTLVAGLALITACRGGGPAAAAPAVTYGQHVFAGGVAPAGATLQNPYRGDRASAAQGEVIFSAMNCDGCHGGGGTGWVGPSLADGRWRFGGSDGAIYQSIYYGRPHGMPAYGGLLLSSDAVWKLVTYLQSLAPPVDVPTEAWDTSGR